MADATAAGDGGLTPAARRILDVASELFYQRGIRAVGVDTIAAESGITKRTLYDRFGSKEALVAAYLGARDERWRAFVESRIAAVPAGSPARVLAPFDALAEWTAPPPSARGCAFLNAFGELPEPDHPARAVVIGEKTWLRDRFRALLAEAGAARPDGLAVQLLSLHEGAVVAYSMAGERGAAAEARAAARVLLDRAVAGG
ncbi:TetR family transcriptional regulator [Murinocardiopsis flavida]|uniref:TetR family transcriptional regulator n=1 Tax=Murinocardiopsis flavida TaxID=645275 RepID=A0A2P8DUJ2_9ACTN|nr:TetR/AcrR family transcriptional regulator [Murinocardiopsis flavida]PSL00890.1 TetR family transcriptional regulator [Murinocardiopsis flavida]